jgi:DNA-binding transcriptional ArsR family regulator
MSPRLSIIPAGAVTDRSLEPRDLQVLCLLGRHLDKLGWCVRSQVKMAAEIFCSRSSVQRSLDRLYEAGWVERKRRGEIIEGVEPGQPSASYAYRVRLDRDDYAVGTAVRVASESHAENASRDGDCPPVGTPLVPENHPQGAQPDGHPGAQPCVGTGAHVCVGTMNDPLERSTVEREREVRARGRKARFIVAFEARWPTAAADDRQKTAYAAEALTEIEEEAALNGIGPFLENLKRLGRKHPPAGWKYLEEKRWTLLEQAKKTEPNGLILLPADSPEAAAIRAIYELAGCKAATSGFMRAVDGGLWYRREVTPQLLALASLPPTADWVELDYRQARAWTDLVDKFVTVASRKRLHAGDRAPSAWPPRKDGSADSAGPPNAMTEADARELSK